MKLGVYTHHNFYATAERTTRKILELALYPNPTATPATGLSTCHKTIARLVFLYQIHVAMPSHFLYIGKFSLHPIFIGYGEFNSCLYHLVELL